MKERPILFSDALVRAILEGRKTETRRPFVPRSARTKDLFRQLTEGEQMIRNGGDGSCLRGCKDRLVRDHAPFGAPGDRLWIRECFAKVAFNDEDETKPVYRADGCDYSEYTTLDNEPFRWTPSIHMPRWASRITLDITSIGVERVQDITEEGAQREGFERNEWPARENFARAWDGIYGNWEASPWVWVVGFKVAEVKR